MSTDASRTSRAFLFLVVISLIGTFHAAAQGTGTTVVISQVYGGGGNSGATYKNDFVELLNRTASPINVTGWSVQYASATGSTWQVTKLSGTIGAYRYFLIQEATGAGGIVNLPTPDAVGTIAMSASAAKVALVSDTTALVGGGTPGSCPSAGVVDLVGYGTTATCFEGSPAPQLSNTTAAIRAGAGVTDTQNNSADFSAAAPNPRNSQSNPAVGIPPEESGSGIPRTLLLFRNFPNPFNPSTTIDYALPHASVVSLKVYDMLGREVATLVEAEMPAGKHRATFDATGLPSGAYICRIQAAGTSASSRLLLIR